MAVGGIDVMELGHEIDSENDSSQPFIEVKRKHKRPRQNSSIETEVENETTKAKGSPPQSASRMRPSSESNEDERLTIKIKSIDPNQNITKLNPIQIMNEITKVTSGTMVKYIKRMRDGFLVRCNTYNQARSLQDITELGRIPVRVSTGMNVVKGVISNIPLDISEEELFSELKKQNVVSVKRLRRRENGKLIQSKSVLITFSGLQLPNEVKMGFELFTVRQFVAPVLRCHKCQNFGHVEEKCRGKLRCVRCGEGHEFKDCKEKENRKCARCGGPHSAAYKGCKEYKIQKEIIKVKTFTNISYAEAAKQVKNTMGDQDKIPSVPTNQNDKAIPNQTETTMKNTTEQCHRTPKFQSKIPTIVTKKKTTAQVHTPSTAQESTKKKTDPNPNHTQRDIIQAFIGVSNSMVSFLAFMIKALHIIKNPKEAQNQNIVDTVLFLSRACLKIDVDKEQLESKLREIELLPS